MDKIFCPIAKSGLQIVELDPEEIMGRVTNKPGRQNIYIINFEEKLFEVNLGATRYHVFKNSNKCACCGIRATRCFLELDVQNTKERGTDTYSIHFYAEVGKPDHHPHLIMMTRDHIVAKSKNGSDSIDNSQTLCYNCNCVKGVTDFTVEQIRSILFPAYRAYSSSCVLMQAKEKTELRRMIIHKNKITIENITRALNIVNDERTIEMRKKIVKIQDENKQLELLCDQIEIQAQVNGFC